MLCTFTLCSFQLNYIEKKKAASQMLVPTWFSTFLFTSIFWYTPTSVNICESYLGPKTSPRGSASVSASVRRGRRNIMVMYISSSCCADTGAWGVAWIHIFAYIYVGFEWRKGLVRNQADLHCSVTCCKLFCSKVKSIPACSACRLWARRTFLCGDQCGEFSISLPKASCQNTATDIQKRNAVHIS